MDNYYLDRRVRYTEYEVVKEDSDSQYFNAEPVHKFGFCIGEKVHSGRYPQFSCDFEIVMYQIETKDGNIVEIYEDDVLFLGWKREIV